MKKLFLFLLNIIPLSGLCKNGDVFSVKTIENIDMKFTVTNEQNKTCQVGLVYRWPGVDPAIDKSYSGHITIPSSANGYTVTSIAENAFTDCILSSVTIPNTVTSLDVGAFYNCKISSVSMPNSVTSIGQSAFYGCSELSSVILPDSIACISNGMFYDCASLKHIVIPESVSSIESLAFAGCANLSSIELPKSLTGIGRLAFAYCTSIESIVIPSSVKSIGEEAFNNCTRLKSVLIPNSVISIGSYAFANCTKMESVLMSDNVESFDKGLFHNCKQLVSVNMPSKLSSIGESCFENCENLISISIPDSVISIGKRALYNCRKLSAIVWDVDFPINRNIIDYNWSTNLIIYVKNEDYAPSNTKNLIVNGIAKKITLTDKGGVNNFYCPREFTAEQISYTHNYRMKSGLDGKAQGWETIALPFTVAEITHESKGKLLPFAIWNNTSDAKPFWLCKLSSNGFTHATSIEANTPYIICMPNNSDYADDYNLTGEVTFSATNAKVSVSSSVITVRSNDKMFIPTFFAQEKATTVYALNVSNNFHSELGGYTEGSAFVSFLREVSPFEAYMTASGSNAKRAFAIELNEATDIDRIPTAGYNNSLFNVYNLNGQLLKEMKSQRELEEIQKQLPSGVYVINGKKILIK